MPATDSLQALAGHLRPRLVWVAEARSKTVSDAFISVGEADPSAFVAQGVIVGNAVFSSADFITYFPQPFFESEFFSFRSLASPELTGTLARLYASSMGVLVLAPDDLHCISSEDDGPTSDCWALLQPEEEPFQSNPSLVRFLFQGDRLSTTVKGYCFTADGQAILPATIRVERHSELLHLNLEAEGVHWMGGPIFSEHGDLVGICSNQEIVRSPNRDRGVGKRLDVTLPPLIAERMHWHDLTV